MNQFARLEFQIQIRSQKCLFVTVRIWSKQRASHLSFRALWETHMAKPDKAEILELVTTRARNKIRGSVRLEMPDLATLYVDENGPIESDQPADITLTANSQVFHDIAMGILNPAKAFMMRKLKVDGNPMKALKIGEILSAQA